MLYRLSCKVTNHQGVYTLQKHLNPIVLLPCCSKSSAAKPEPKFEESETPKTEIPIEKPVKEKNEKPEDDVVQRCTVPNKSFLQKVSEKIKNKIDRAAFEVIPSQYKYPLVKGLAINQIDPAMLVFPEYDETADVIKADTFALKIEKLMTDQIDSVEVDQTKHLPDTFMDQCKELGLFGLEIPKKYGGQELCHKALARCHEEMSRDWSAYTALSAHNDLAVKAIQLFGTDSQKEKYLPRLASGESLGAFCLHESSSGNDTAALKTTAVRSLENPGQLVLNGTKSWVTGAVNADILIVFGKICQRISPAESDELVPTTAFIVDRKEIKSGITDIERKDTFGLRGVNISGLKFKNVNLDDSCILGVEETGFFVAQKTMAANRYLFPAAAAACLKRCLTPVVRHCNITQRYEAMMSDSNIMKKRVCQISRDIFALETLSYYMAGWLDDNPKKDFSLEGALATRFARRLLRENLENMMEIMGAESRTTDMHFGRILRDISTLSAYMGGDDVLAGYVGSETFKVFAAEHKQTLFMVMNKIQYPAAFSKHKFKLKEMYFEDLKLKHYLNEHVHPSLEDACRFVEQTMARFDGVFKSVVFSTGKLVEEEHITLGRVADILTNIFVMLTVISRASRSYCIGLKNADNEMYFAEYVCRELQTKTHHLLVELIEIDCPNTTDLYMKRIGEEVMKNKGYMLERPTTRNW